MEKTISALVHELRKMMKVIDLTLDKLFHQIEKSLQLSDRGNIIMVGHATGLIDHMNTTTTGQNSIFSAKTIEIVNKELQTCSD